MSNIIFPILVFFSALGPLCAQTLEDLVPDVVEPSYEKTNKVYQEYELDRIRSGEVLFNRVTSIYPFRLTVTLSFDSDYKIFEVIDKVEEYGLSVVGFHHDLGGAYFFSDSSNPRDEVQNYLESMGHMVEVMISTFEPMTNDEFLNKMLRADAKRQLNGFKSLESALNGDGQIRIIGVDVKGRGRTLRKFVDENSNFAKAKEIVLPGGRFSAISPLSE